jgi:hypothetical protein
MNNLDKKIATSLRRRLIRLAVSMAAMVAMAAISAPLASALSFETLELSTNDTSGAPVRQAGSHPDVRTEFTVPQIDPSDPETGPVEQPHQFLIELPPGLVGNPTAVPSCPESGLKASAGGFSPVCPVGSQIGVARVLLAGGAEFITFPVWNVTAPVGMPALFAFNVLGVIVRLSPTVRAGDYGVTIDSGTISTGVNLAGSDVTLWGVPADPSHDAARGGPSQSPRVPFLSMPTSCSGAAQSFSARVDGWDSIGQFGFKSVSSDPSGEPFVNVGCDRLAFEPTLVVASTSRNAGSPTGLDVELKVPQSEAPGGLATAHVRDVTVTLPQGMTLSPSSASGLGACTDAQFDIQSNAPENCPESSKVGSATVVSPLLEEPLLGSLYIGNQLSNDPLSGKMYRLFLVVAGSGVRIKVEGAVKADPVTGRLTTTFAENPQLPFSSLELNLDSGPASPLSNPTTCGTYTTEATLTSWSGKTVETSSPFVVSHNCDVASQFTPSLEAGVVNPAAGKSSTFVLSLSRPDGQQNIAGLTVNLPEGQLAKLAGVAVCGDAAAASGNCPAASQVGSAVVAAGPGTNPITVPQPGRPPTAVYLAGPYKGAPYSLVVNVPAQAGPFDLGTVVVRNALQIDPSTVKVTAVSDPLPQVLGGIPISYRDIEISIDRPGFIQNPTSCEPTSVGSTITSSGGAVAHPSSRYQVGDCANLDFQPKLGVRLSGAPPRRGANPALQATVTPPSGDANIGKAAVILPATELLEQGHIRTVCTRVQFAANECPAGSIYGHAKAWTPLLDTPLEGPVYLRSNGGERKLPDLVADLNGSIHVVLVGYIDSVKRNGTPRIRTRFLSVPDAPVSKFVLNMQGGKKSLLANNTNLCKAKPRAEALLTGQNGKESEAQPLVSVAGCGKKKAKSKK